MLTQTSDATLHQYRESKSFIKDKQPVPITIERIPERKKIVLVGDGAAGKTSFLAYYSEKKFLEEYVPTVFENITMNATVQGVPYELALWDTSGQDDYARLRPVSYPDTDVFLVCFSVDSKTSFVNAETKVYLINAVD
jgi:small GTP-binding protein